MKITITRESLTRASEATCDWPANCGFSTAILLDPTAGELYTRDISNNSWMERSETCEPICYTSRHMSEQDIIEHIGARNDVTII